MKKQPAKPNLKYLVFPGDSNDPTKPSQSLVLTGKIIGQGQFGIVQYAYNLADENDVYAVKCIDKNKIQGSKDMHNLQNEIAIMAEIRSPYVVALRDATKTASNYYLAMELCNGGDLEGFRKARGGFLQEQEARLILRQIMKGIQAIKEKNVMHRDLKLPNVMINFAELAPNICTQGEFVLKDYIAHFDFKTQHQTLTCKIADLGFARKLEEDQLAKTGCGTPLLMAPEVLGGQLYNHKADVWSLGCLFYELLTGFMPFTGISHQNLRDNLKRGVFKIPKSVKISLQGVSFLQACLQYETSKRISWQEIVSHPYIASEGFDGQDLDLTLSYIGGHTQVMVDPFKWMNEHKDDVYELNTRNADKFDMLYHNKLMQFQQMLDQDENKAVQPLLLQSRMIQNFNQQIDDNTEMSTVDVHVKEVSPVSVAPPKEKQVFDAYSDPVPLQFIPKRSQQQEEELVRSPVQVINIEEASLIETVIQSVDKSHQFVDVMKESQFALQQGQVKWITRNLRMKGEPVNIKGLKVVQNYF